MNDSLHCKPSELRQRARIQPRAATLKPCRLGSPRPVKRGVRGGAEGRGDHGPHGNELGKMMRVKIIDSRRPSAPRRPPRCSPGLSSPLLLEPSQVGWGRWTCLVAANGSAVFHRTVASQPALRIARRGKNMQKTSFYNLASQRPDRPPYLSQRLA